MGSSDIAFNLISAKLDLSTMDYDFYPSPNLSITVQQVGNQKEPVLLIENYLRDPQSAVRYAAEKMTFTAPPTHYPGITAVSPNEYVTILFKALSPAFRDMFGVNVDGPCQARSFFGLATTPPEKLNIGQRLPHIDTPDPKQIAVLHYLCDASHGGTSFYRHRATGFEAPNPQQYMQMNQMLAEDAKVNGDLPSQYVTTSNRLYEQTASFDAKFNRMIIYRSHILHAGSISPTANLSTDPRVGRLTANTFLAFKE